MLVFGSLSGWHHHVVIWEDSPWTHCHSETIPLFPVFPCSCLVHVNPSLLLIHRPQWDPLPDCQSLAETWNSILAWAPCSTVFRAGPAITVIEFCASVSFAEAAIFLSHFLLTLRKAFKRSASYTAFSFSWGLPVPVHDGNSVCFLLTLVSSSQCEHTYLESRRSSQLPEWYLPITPSFLDLRKTFLFLYFHASIFPLTPESTVEW